LILMATRTYRAEAFLNAAAHIGLGVTVGTEREQVLAELTPGATLALDFRRPGRARRQIVEFARRYPLAAVVGVDDDTTILAAMAAEALGLLYNSVDSVKAAHYKDVMRLVLSETDLNTPEFRVVGIDEDPSVIADRLSYPCVVKPLALSASRGVIRANDPAELVAAFREVLEIVREADLPPDDQAARQIMIESYIPGHEVALEGLLRNGELAVLALFDKPDPLEGPYFEETIYLTPSRLSAEAQAAIVECAARATAALGLRQGPVHVELRLNEAGPWIIEAAPRSIGGLCSKVLRFGEGLSLEELILRQAAGLDIPSLERERQPAGVMMVPIPRGGVLLSVHGLTEARAVPGIEEITIGIRPGQEVTPLPRGTRYLGFIFAGGHSPEVVEAALREAHGKLRFEISDFRTQTAD
jgi:biotin carboxylase